MWSGALAEDVVQCGMDVKAVSADSVDFYFSKVCNERTALTGVVSMSLVIGSDGRAKSMRILSSAITPPGSTPCAEFQALKMAKAMRFTAPISPCRMTFPMNFTLSVQDLGVQK
jgi:hypothetical protein